MLIPLYVLIGAWGGVRRTGSDAQVHRLHDGGLAPDARLRSSRSGCGNGSFDMTELSPSDNTWIFLGFLVAFAVKAPLFPFHGWLPDAYREAPSEVSALLSGVISKTAVYGVLRIVLPIVPRPGGRLADGRPGARRDRARLRVAPRVPRAGRARRDRLLEPRADVPDLPRAVRRQRLRTERRAPPERRARPDLRLALPPRRHGRAAHRHRRARAPRRDGARAARARDALHHRRRDRPGGAVLGRVRGRVPDPERRLRARVGLGGRRAPSRSCWRRCTSCA